MAIDVMLDKPRQILVDFFGDELLHFLAELVPQQAKEFRRCDKVQPVVTVVRPRLVEKAPKRFAEQLVSKGEIEYVKHS